MVGQPAAREVIAGKVHIARRGLAAMFLGQDESTIGEETAQTIGTFYRVLLSGLVLQWLIDPASSLRAETLKDALRATAETLGPKQTAKKQTKRSVKAQR